MLNLLLIFRFSSKIEYVNAMIDVIVWMAATKSIASIAIIILSNHPLVDTLDCCWSCWPSLCSPYHCIISGTDGAEALAPRMLSESQPN